MTSAPAAIDRQSPVPYYQQLVEVLEARIAEGSLTAGQRLPSENELCTEFGLSRATVRQALQVLESRGNAARIPGRGVFVSDASEPESGWMIQGPEGFLENAIRNQNGSVETRVLRHGRVTLGADAARALRVEEGAPGYQLVRLRSLDGVPAVYSTNILPEPLIAVVEHADDVLSGAGALTDAVAQAGYTLGGAQRTIQALPASDEVAEALGIRPDEPLLRVRSTSWSTEGVHFDTYETWVRSDVVPLEVNVGVVPLTRPH